MAKKSRGRCSIVFITAYDQYVVQAFESEAVDYILKPVNPDRFRRVHRNAIVNLEKIQAAHRSFTGQMVIRLADTDREIRVSRAYIYLFKAM